MLKTKATAVPKRGVSVTLVYVVLATAIYLGFKHGWLDLQGRTMQDIRELQIPVEERISQIKGRIHPHPQATER